MEMTIDIVRDVVGYEGLYKIDIFGNVIRVKDNKEMSQQINKFGYANVSLCADAIGGNAQDIYRCLRGKTKTHKGFHYKEIKDGNVD